MKLIANWLAGKRNFIIGRALYKQFGNNKQLVTLFDKGETAFSRQKLVEALTALASAPAQSTPILCKQIKKETRTVMPKGSDAVLAALEAEWRPLYQRMNVLRHKLDEYGKDNSLKARAECKLLCDEILDLEQQCKLIWEKRDHYVLHGQLPATPVKDEFNVPADPIQAGKLIETIKRNIRRNKEKLAKHADKAVYADKIKMYEGQLSIILSKIDTSNKPVDSINT